MRKSIYFSAASATDLMAYVEVAEVSDVAPDVATSKLAVRPVSAAHLPFHRPLPQHEVCYTKSPAIVLSTPEKSVIITQISPRCPLSDEPRVYESLTEKYTVQRQLGKGSVSELLVGRQS